MEQLSTREKARALASAVEIGDFSYWSSGSIESALAKYFNTEPGLVGYKIKEVFFHDKDSLDQLKEFNMIKKSYKKGVFDYSVRDFFDIPTAYHFYKYQQMIASVFNSNMEITKAITANKSLKMRKSVDPTYNNGKPIISVSNLLYVAIEAYKNLPDEENMMYRYFSPNLNVGLGAVRFKNPRKLAKDSVDEYESLKLSKITSSQKQSMIYSKLKRERNTNLFKGYKYIVKDCESEVFDHMLKTLKSEKFSNEQIQAIKEIKEGPRYLGFSSSARIIVSEIEESKSDTLKQQSMQDLSKENINGAPLVNNANAESGVIEDENGQLAILDFVKSEENNSTKGFDN